MQVQTLPDKSSANNSFQNYQSKQCDFCLYHSVIFEQLDRLKEAVVMKNHRIKELEEFIAKISSMAFLKTPSTDSFNSAEKVSKQSINESNQYLQNQDSMNSQNGFNGMYFKKKFQQSSEISFQESMLNTGKFENKLKQNSTGLSRRIQKINELNELKRQLQQKISETTDKQNYEVSERTESHNNSNQFDTMRTLSEPYQEGRIGSIPGSSCENSRLSELSQTKIKFQESTGSIKIESNSLGNSSLKKYGSQEDKSSINIIKQHLRKLK